MLNPKLREPDRIEPRDNPHEKGLSVKDHAVNEYYHNRVDKIAASFNQDVICEDYYICPAPLPHTENPALGIVGLYQKEHVLNEQEWQKAIDEGRVKIKHNRTPDDIVSDVVHGGIGKITIVGMPDLAFEYPGEDFEVSTTPLEGYERKVFIPFHTPEYMNYRSGLALTNPEE